MLVIWNPSAGSANEGRQVRTLLNRRDDVHLVETHSKDHARRLCREAAAKEEMVVAAGGDGTINTVINALMDSETRAPRLGLLPMGTGNTLCQALGISVDPIKAVALLDTNAWQTIDLVRVASDEGEMYYANVASGGNSDRVVESLSSEEKQKWGAWCYLKSALPLVSELKSYTCSIQIDDQPDKECYLWNILIANGPNAAGGICVAPVAQIDDGWLDVILIDDGTPLDLIELTAEFLLGNYLDDERVMHCRAKFVRIDVARSQPLRFLADGELIAGSEYHFESVPQRLRVAVPTRTTN